VRLIAADWVVTSDGPPVRSGVVVTDDAGTIVEVRPRRESDDLDPLRGVVLPGLVNAHAHVEGSAYAGKVERGGGIAAFGQGWMAARRETSFDDVHRAARAAVDALVDCGTALVGDVTNTGVALPMFADAGVAAIVFHESIGGPPDAPFDRATPAAHTPWSSPPEWIVAAYRAAAESGALTSLHVAEHADERRFLLDGDGPIRDLFRFAGAAVPFPIPGRPSVPYLADLGALGPFALAVHCADATPAERSILRERRSPVVLCPRSNDYIGGRLPDLPAFLEEGFRPALGTDSLASSPSLDVLEEARALHAVFPEISCATLLAMSTAWGAAAMGRPSWGAIRPGAAPGLLLAPAVDAPADPEKWLVETCPPRWLVRPGGAG